MKILIYGVPGVGKTHYAKVLGKELHLSVIEADKLRKPAQKNTSKKESPFLYLGTCLAYKQFGDLNKENAIRGLLAVRQALSAAVDAEIRKSDDVIIEGAFLDPRLITQFGRVILLTTTDAQKHKKQFLSHPERLFDFAGREFKSARIVQEYLIEEAKKLGIEVVDNCEEFN